MNSECLFHLGYSTITWGPTPDLDRVLGTIADAAGVALALSAAYMASWARCTHLEIAMASRWFCVSKDRSSKERKFSNYCPISK